jgi:hypothetical protein
MRRTLKRTALVTALALSVLGVAGAPAQAHFERGGNCHINEVRGNGGVELRISNRATDDHYVECVLKTWGGNDGASYWSVERWVIARHYRIVNVRLPGSWEWVKVTHVHVR